MKPITDIKISLIKNWRWPALIVLAIIFFLGTSSFSFFTQDKDHVKWLSPDETANYVFTKLYCETGEMQIFESYNLEVKDIMHPRSFRSDHGNLKPVSFLGLIIIYGKIAAVFGYRVTPYLTPFFGALGLVFFYLIIKTLFGQRNAFISVFVLAVFPPYVYYSARGMFHNVLFTVLLLGGLYFAILMARNGKTKAYWRWLSSACAGAFIGLAVIVRSSELLWLAPVWLILWLFNIRKIGITKLVIFLAFLVLALLPALYWNQRLYGAPFFGGYPEMNSSLVSLAETGSEMARSTILGNVSRLSALAAQLSDTIFYFGFKPYESFKMGYYYFARMFPWLFVPALLGAVLFFIRFKKIRKKHLAYLAAYVVLSVILIFYYGSWGFHDNPDPKSFTIGNSYTRYWLPVYLGAIPFLSWFIMTATRLLFPKRLFIVKIEKNKSRFALPRREFCLKGARVLAVAVIAVISINFVLFGSEEGMVYAAHEQRAARKQLDLVFENTEIYAAIITQYHDKLFFPERKVIVGLFNDDNMNAEYAKLSGKLPLYYYNFTFPEKDINYLNNNRLLKADLRIDPVKRITKDFTLYRLSGLKISSTTKLIIIP